MRTSTLTPHYYATTLELSMSGDVVVLTDRYKTRLLEFTYIPGTDLSGLLEKYVETAASLKTTFREEFYETEVCELLVHASQFQVSLKHVPVDHPVVTYVLEHDGRFVRLTFYKHSQADELSVRVETDRTGQISTVISGPLTIVAKDLYDYVHEAWFPSPAIAL